MPQWEKRAVDFFARHALKIGFVLMLLASALVRRSQLPFYTNDVHSFLLPWIDELRQKGLYALADGLGDYNVPYLLILHLIGKLTHTQTATVYAIKAVSIIFDYLMAVGVGCIVYQAVEGRAEKARKRLAFFAMAGATLLPLVMLNSGLWGQCDAIYGCFSVWAVYLLLRGKYPGAFVLLGLALSFKLQAVFILPLFIILYFTQKRFSVLLFLIPPGMVFASALPAVPFGAGLLNGFTVYLKQTGEYESIYFNYPNFSALIQDSRYRYFATGLVLLALLVCFAMLAWLLRRGIKPQGYTLLALAVWSVYACVLFLPSMHERYAYVGEVLIFAAAVARPVKHTVIPALVLQFSAYCVYASFLFHFVNVPPQYLALLSLAAFAYFTWGMLGDMAHSTSRATVRPRGKEETQHGT